MVLCNDKHELHMEIVQYCALERWNVVHAEAVIKTEHMMERNGAAVESFQTPVFLLIAGWCFFFLTLSELVDSLKALAYFELQRNQF